jgi:hypothetical protein
VGHELPSHAAARISSGSPSWRVLPWFARGLHASALQIGATVTAVLLIVAVWESFALRRPAKPA